jgi:hypothetical protein
MNHSENKHVTIWDHLNNITNDKKEFLGDEGWNIWMINRFISMDQDYCEVVDALQKNLRPGSYISNELMYKVYRDILPKHKKYFKYIKATNPKKYNSEELEIVAEHYEISQTEAKTFIDMLDKKVVKELVSQYKGK